ncbi:MAG: hypothetical protein QXE87_04945 [Candidatus Methanomethylicaceae archaeon]
MNKTINLLEAINDALLGFALSIPLETAGAIVLRNPPYIYSSFDILICKLIILLLAITIIEIARHWGFVYTIGYFLGFLLMSTILGLEVLNLIAIIMIIAITLLITIIRIMIR